MNISLNHTSDAGDPRLFERAMAQWESLRKTTMSMTIASLLRSCSRLSAGLGLLIATNTAVASVPALEQHWYAVLFDGLKAGHLLSERETLADRIITRETMSLEIRRAGVSLEMGSMEQSEESIDGTPLSFRGENTMTGSSTIFIGERSEDGSFDVTTVVDGTRSSSNLKIEAGALFLEGQRKAILASNLAPGSIIEFQAFQPSLLQTVRVVTKIGNAELVEALDQDLSLIAVDQSIYFAGTPVRALAFVNDEYQPQRISMDLQGIKIELVQCDQACATAPNQGAEALRNLLIRTPPHSQMNVHQPMRFKLSGKDLNTLPQTGHQRSMELGWLQIDPEAGADLSPASAEETKSTPWLQSEDPEIIALARKALGSRGRPAAQRMADAEEFVARYIDGKTLSVGYASALEVARSRRGDCTEHALLLAALARAEGIPSRVVTGFAFVPEFAGEQGVFVPHAWIEARVEQGWTGYDAALGGFNSGHIALATGDGDPTRFYSSIHLLSSLKINAMEAAPQQ